MVSELDQEEQEFEVRNERQGSGTVIRFGQVFMNLKQLKSLEILKSSVKIFTSNTRFMLFMILSIFPLFSFMFFYEIKLQETVWAAGPMFQQESLRPFRIVSLVAAPTYPQQLVNDTVLSDVPEISEIEADTSYSHYDYSEVYNREHLLFSNLLQLCVFYMVLYPLLEIFSMVVTMKIAAKVHAGEKQATLKEILCEKNNLKGLSVTCLCVHLLSNLTLVGLFWTATNHRLFTSQFYFPAYFFDPLEVYSYILSLVLHSAFFIALLYKYLDWSAFWNMGIVISVLEEETGIWAFGMSDYYGKHCKRTGFQLMLILFAFGNFLRLPCLFAVWSNVSVGVLVTAIIIGLVCLVNLVKWVAFVLYFYHCEQQTLVKKVDEDVGKHKNASNQC